jgi:bidirectional [NiFe] hydrogenase diaphorase subunit
MIRIIIDGREMQAEEGMTVLDAARAAGVLIPALCFHPALKPSGSCKLCYVQLAGGREQGLTVLSCVLRVKEGLAIATAGDAVMKARTRAFRNLLQMAPHSAVIRDLARASGVSVGPPPDECIRCRLCIRVCKEIVGPAALKIEKRDGHNYVVPEKGGLCIGCGTCANICPTGAIRLEDRETVRTIVIRDEVIGMHPLQRCEGCGKYFATERFLSYVHRRTGPHPDTKIRHRYCSTCAKLFSDRIVSFRDRAQKLIL